jgi:hypothetical protein
MRIGRTHKQHARTAQRAGDLIKPDEKSTPTKKPTTGKFKIDQYRLEETP